MLHNRLKQYMVFICDAVLISVSIFLSYALRFSTLRLDPHIGQILVLIPLVLLVRLSIFWLNGLYNGMWRFVSTSDLISIIRAVSLSTLIYVCILFLFQAAHEYPRSLFIIDWFVMIVLIGGSRFTYRLYRSGFYDMVLNGRPKESREAKKVLIVGAGRAGEIILREILGNYQLKYSPVGFVDDNRSKRNQTIHGYPVLGNSRDIPNIAKTMNVDKVFIATPSASPKAKRRIMLTCKSAGLKVKTLPGVGELLNGTVKVSALRDFQIEDLLGRQPVKLDMASIRDYLRDKTVMITGAGGSIGSELCRQVAHFKPKRLVLFERSEFNLYQIEMNLLELFPQLETCAVIGDILNQKSVERTLVKYMPEVIFHAAAYKHVPLMEMNPIEALRNNVFGTWTIANLAQTYGVRKFVMVSTDKAVRPTNIMGASKRMAELICQAFYRNSKTQFVTVRFGNVLNSVGSVIPLFKRQIEKGGPLTVTHPEIYRYFMTIPEAVQLIMQAGAMGKGGEIFILDMGEAIKIVDLARDMITLSGLEPEKDIEIVFTGLRPGEKLYEELLTEGEEIKETIHEKIKVAKMEVVQQEELFSRLDKLLFQLLKSGFTQDIVKRIKQIVPEYQPEKGGPSIENNGSMLKKHSYEVSRSPERLEQDSPETRVNTIPINNIEITSPLQRAAGNLDS